MSPEDEASIDDNFGQPSLAGSHPEKAPPFVQVEERFQGIMLRLRQSKYIPLEAMRTLDLAKEFEDRPDLIVVAEPMQRYCAADINIHEENALSHLCLRFNLQYFLQQVNRIHGIDALKRHIQNNSFRIELKHRPDRYPEGNILELEVIQALKAWEDLPE